MKRFRRNITWLALPWAALFMLLYVLPFLITIGYSVLDNAFDMQYVGGKNYMSAFGNRYFLMALKNTIAMTVVLLIVTTVLAVVVGFFLQQRKSGMGQMVLLVLPMLIPSVSCAAIWREVFDTGAFASTFICYLALVSLFAWKYTGAAAVLLYTGLREVDPSIWDAAALDGAGRVRAYLSISLPCVRNHLSVMLMLILMFALRIYKESYLLFGLYPGDDMYLIAHYMSNHFIKMNYQNVAVSSVTLAGMALVLLLFAGLSSRREVRGK